MVESAVKSGVKPHIMDGFPCYRERLCIRPYNDHTYQLDIGTWPDANGKPIYLSKTTPIIKETTIAELKMSNFKELYHEGGNDDTYYRICKYSEGNTEKLIFRGHWVEGKARRQIDVEINLDTPTSVFVSLWHTGEGGDTLSQFCKAFYLDDMERIRYLCMSIFDSHNIFESVAIDLKWVLWSLMQEPKNNTDKYSSEVKLAQKVIDEFEKAIPDLDMVHYDYDPNKPPVIYVRHDAD